jgi:hypothetical protein
MSAFCTAAGSRDKGKRRLYGGHPHQQLILEKSIGPMADEGGQGMTLGLLSRFFISRYLVSVAGSNCINMASHLCGLPVSFNPGQHFDTIGGNDGPDIDSNRRAYSALHITVFARGGTWRYTQVLY